MISYERYIGASNWIYGSSKLIANAQTFTPSIGHWLRAVKLKLGRWGPEELGIDYPMGLPGMVTISLRDTVDGFPSDVELMGVEIDGDALFNDSDCRWESIDLGSSYYVEPEHSYAIAVEAPFGDLDNMCIWRCQRDSNPYLYGQGYYKVGQSGWLDRDADFLFEELGTTIRPGTIPLLVGGLAAVGAVIWLTRNKGG